MTERFVLLPQPFQSKFSLAPCGAGCRCQRQSEWFRRWRFVGDATVPLTKARSCEDAERAGALYEFILSFGLRADNTWSDLDCVTKVGWRHECRESQVDHLFSSEETPLLDVWVDSSLVCGSDHLAVVGTCQIARSVGDLGPCKKKRIPCASVDSE